MPAGNVSPRSRAIKFLIGPWACAKETSDKALSGPTFRPRANATAPIRAAIEADRRTRFMMRLLRKGRQRSLRSSRGPSSASIVQLQQFPMRAQQGCKGRDTRASIAKTPGGKRLTTPSVRPWTFGRIVGSFFGAGRRKSEAGARPGDGGAKSLVPPLALARGWACVRRRLSPAPCWNCVSGPLAGCERVGVCLTGWCVAGAAGKVCASAAEGRQSRSSRRRSRMRSFSAQPFPPSNKRHCVQAIGDLELCRQKWWREAFVSLRGERKDPPERERNDHRRQTRAKPSSGGNNVLCGKPIQAS